ncbi:hypothetical protein JTB14_033676 [Gonioctena quinquepunctata]|nr:hypothetical protein JTB14_033676 [Gonioctena quinquepunctata]
MLLSRGIRGPIANPKNTSKVIIDLNSVLPLPELQHLKRVKGKDVLLFPVMNTDKKLVHSLLKQHNFDITQLENNIRITLVMKVPPKTRRQFEIAHKLWPCNFHPNKYLEKLVTNNIFSNDELRHHQLYMTIAVDVARYAKQNIFQCPQIGAVVVDPKMNSVVAVGYKKTNEGPFCHAAMVAVDNVAKTQNGGVWTTCKFMHGSSHLDLRGLPKGLLTILQDKYDTVCFGANKYKSKNELLQPTDGPYLCTGYYVYLTREPCIMCAMGLIHSRVKRVFFGAKSSNGGLGTLCKIHTLKDLNHHYEVWGGLLEHHCSEL